MRSLCAAFVRDTRAAVGAEFALLVGLFLLFLFGIIDAARFAWTMNEAQKASQAAVRHAVVTDFVADGLDDYNFTDSGYFGGDPIPAADVGSVSCDDSDCSPASLSVGGDSIDITYDPAAFDGILTRAQLSFPQLEAANLRVIYQHVGLGYAGDPDAADIAPLVIVQVRDIAFQPTILFGLEITLPPVEASMTMEDGDGEESYSG